MTANYEAMIQICGEIGDAISQGSGVETLVKRLDYEAHGTRVAPDAKKLRNLAAMVDIPDLDKHRCEMLRIAKHAKMVAGEWA